MSTTQVAVICTVVKRLDTVALHREVGFNDPFLERCHRDNDLKD